MSTVNTDGCILVDMKDVINDPTVQEAKKRFLGLSVPQLIVLAMCLFAAYFILGPIFALIKTIVILAALAVVGYAILRVFS